MIRAFGAHCQLLPFTEAKNDCRWLAAQRDHLGLASKGCVDQRRLHRLGILQGNSSQDIVPIKRRRREE
jgi:hypothetical protein